MLLRKIHLNSRARTTVKDNEVNICLRTDMLPGINNEHDFYNIMKVICTEEIYRISLIHEVCHVLQIVSYGKEFYTKCNDLFVDNPNNSFLEIEAYTQQAINMNGNLRINPNDLILWVKNLNDGMQKQMKETILNNEEYVRKLFEFKSYIPESENPIHFDAESVTIEGGTAEEMKDCLKQAEKYDPGISKDFIFIEE